MPTGGVFLATPGEGTSVYNLEFVYILDIYCRFFL
jgi:hypothetical protein